VRPHRTMPDWKKRCEAEWSLQGAPMPDSLDWKSVYDAKPLGRNMLKNPSPNGKTTTTTTTTTLDTRLERALVLLCLPTD